MNRFSIVLFFILLGSSCFAQLEWDSVFGKNTEKEINERLLTNRGIQIETTSAINNMYNFKFHEAEKEYKWLLVKFPNHPIGYFLSGLNEWWQIVSNTNDNSHDEKLLSYMDKAIDKGEILYKRNKDNKEAAFFMSVGYAFKGRLYAERENWVKAAYNGKLSLKYLEKSRGEEHINPELLIGDGLYNYYSIWIRENYSSLKPILIFFRKGNKAKGIKQLEEVSENSFYTRMEARYFLVQIYSLENKEKKAYNIAYQMHVLYPDNAFFHRYLARSSFALGNLGYASTYATQLLNAVESGKVGYGPNEGRYGAYILGYIAYNYKKDFNGAKKYFLQSIEYAKTNESEDAGYTIGAHLALAEIYEKAKELEKSEFHYNEVLNNTDRKSANYKRAKQALKK